MLAKNAEGKCGVKQYLSKKYTELKTAVHFKKIMNAHRVLSYHIV